MHKRPVVNTRDEPHADAAQYRRLHVIVGDANMSEYITALKVGSTALVIDLIEADCLPDYRLKDPIAAMKNIARGSVACVAGRDGGPRPSPRSRD